MWFYKRWKAAFIYGRALMRFRQKRYKEAIRLFWIVCKLEPDDERNELTYNYIARSYLALGHYEEALRMLSRAYKYFKKHYRNMTDESGKVEFIEFVGDYVSILNEVGQHEKAKEIQQEVDQIKRSRNRLH